MSITESVTPSAANGSGDLRPDTYVPSLRARRSRAERDLRIRLLARTTPISLTDATRRLNWL